MALALRAGPALLFPALALLAGTTWVEAMIFCLGCEGHHPDDAFQIESMLAIILNVGVALGLALSFAWRHGPWSLPLEVV